MTQTADRTAAASRVRVLSILRRSPQPLGVADLAATTGLSPTAVRFHLTNLIGLGAVRAAKDPSHVGPGRPATLYSAVPAEAIEPAAAYQFLAGVLARELALTGTAGSAQHAGSTWAAELMRTLRVDLPSSGDARGALDMVVSVFDDAGFRPRVSDDGSLVELHNCPFRELAVRQPDVVCTIHLGLLQGLLDRLGVPLNARLEPELSGDGPCLVRLAGDPSAHPVSRTSSPTEE